MLLARARPPLRPSSTAALLFPSSVWPSSSISPVAIFMTWTALLTTSAGRLCPFGVFGILTAKHTPIQPLDEHANVSEPLGPCRRPGNDPCCWARLHRKGHSTVEEWGLIHCGANRSSACVCRGFSGSTIVLTRSPRIKTWPWLVNPAHHRLNRTATPPNTAHRRS